MGISLTWLREGFLSFFPSSSWNERSEHFSVEKPEFPCWRDESHRIQAQNPFRMSGNPTKSLELDDQSIPAGCQTPIWDFPTFPILSLLLSRIPRDRIPHWWPWQHQSMRERGGICSPAGKLFLRNEEELGPDPLEAAPARSRWEKALPGCSHWENAPDLLLNREKIPFFVVVGFS